MNISLTISLGAAFGVSTQRMCTAIEPAFGVIPPGVEVPVVRLPRIRTALALTRAGIGVARRARAAAATLDADLAQVPARCAQLHRKIADTASDQELAALWTHQVEPLLLDVCQGMEALRLSGRALATVPKQLAVLGR